MDFQKSVGTLHREVLYFAKTQGILYAPVVNSLILKAKDIVIFAAKFQNSFLETERYFVHLHLDISLNLSLQLVTS